jgi:hypothetical protein
MLPLAHGSTIRIRSRFPLTRRGSCFRWCGRRLFLLWRRAWDPHLDERFLFLLRRVHLLLDLAPLYPFAFTVGPDLPLLCNRQRTRENIAGKKFEQQ